MVLAWSRKSFSGPTEIASCVFLIILLYSRTGDARSVQNVIFMFLMRLKGRKRLSSRFSCVAPGMEKYSLNLSRAVKSREYAMKIGCVCVCVWVGVYT